MALTYRRAPKLRAAAKFALPQSIHPHPSPGQALPIRRAMKLAANINHFNETNQYQISTDLIDFCRLFWSSL